MSPKSGFSLKRILPITTVRKNIFKITADVSENSAHYILTEHGHPAAAIIPVHEAEQANYISYAIPSGGASIVADAPQRGYGGMKVQESFFCVGDGSCDKNKPHTRSAHINREVVKSRLTVSLIEEYQYLLERLIVGYYVQVSDNRYIESDIVAHDGKGNAQVIFMVSAYRNFENNIDMAIDDLYTLVKVFKEQGQKGVQYLVYYTRDVEKGLKGKECIVIIDSQLYPTKKAWESAGKKTVEKMPTFELLK